MKKYLKLSFVFIMMFVFAGGVNAIDNNTITGKYSSGKLICISDGDCNNSSLLRTVYKSFIYNNNTYDVYCLDRSYTSIALDNDNFIFTKASDSNLKRNDESWENYQYGLTYILNNKLSATNDEEKFRKTQAAIWLFVEAKDEMLADSTLSAEAAIAKVVKSGEDNLSKIDSSFKDNVINVVKIALEKNAPSFGLSPSYLKFEGSATSNDISFNPSEYTNIKITKNDGNFTINPSKVEDIISEKKFNVTLNSGNIASFTFSGSYKGAYIYISDTYQPLIVDYTSDETGSVEITGTLVKISKTDITGKKELEGAKLRICKYDNTLTVEDELDESNIAYCEDINNEALKEWTSTKDSYYTSLDDGKYILTEITAPEGYNKAESIIFEIDNSNPDTLNVVMKDEEKTVTPPETGVVQTAIFGTLFIVICGAGIYYCKKKNIFVK